MWIRNISFINKAKWVTEEECSTCLTNRDSFNTYGEVAHNDIAIVAAAKTCSNEYREMSRKHNYAANFASQNSTHNT